MSLALALWLIATVGYVAFKAGRRRGRNEMAAEVIRQFAPLQPMLEEISEATERLGAGLGNEDALERVNAMREAGPWN